jgi:3-methylfumaryl-CoA hydratase
MWAGSRFEFRRPIPLGASIQRRTTVLDVVSKRGRNGPLVFVNLRHDILVAGEVAVAEEQDLVFREAPKPDETPPPPQPVPGEAQWERIVEPDPVLLFRFSALTFNGHRIHYDHPYVTGVEGYPGLVVHGPLLGTLLVDLIRGNVADRCLVRFGFRALRPVFDTSSFAIQGRRDDDRVTVWALDNGGALAMSASGELG